MADNSEKAANMSRILAIVHIIVGFHLFCFGTAGLVVANDPIGYIGFGIWIGVWMCIAGGLGIPGTRKERSTSRNAFAGIFMGFSITSAVFGGIIIICYSLSIAFNQYDHYRHYIDTAMALSVIILILGIVEVAIGIWAAVCLCLMKPCTCCYGNPPQQGQVLGYPGNTGFAISHGPGGAPVAVPMQAGGGMVGVQTVTPGAQGPQPQMVMVPASGEQGYQPYLAQAAPAGASYQPQQSEMPPPYRQGQYTKLQNEQ